MRLILTLLIVLLSACMEAPPPPAPSPTMIKMDERSASLLDWQKAGHREKTYFSELYTREHLGSVEPQKARDIITFLDSSVENMRASMAKTGIDSKNVNQLLDKQEIWLLCRAGTRIMQWPSPVGDVSSASDEE